MRYFTAESVSHARITPAWALLAIMVLSAGRARPTARSSNWRVYTTIVGHAGRAAWLSDAAWLVRMGRDRRPQTSSACAVKPATSF